MLTRRVARVRGLSEAGLSLPLLGPLPGDLVKLILRLLPLDARLRAREVRRGWCALLEDASFWTHLSKSCGVNPRFLSDSRLALALLHAARVRAKGNLQSVDLSGVPHCEPPFLLQWAETLSVANKASLRDLVASTPRWLNAEHVTALCRTLPLCRVRCSVECDTVEALPLLRRKPPFALLTIHGLIVTRNEGGEQTVLDLASALSGYKGMVRLLIRSERLATRAVVDALVDGAISAGIKDMCFNHCDLSQTALPALTRLLQSPGFERLEVWNSNDNAALFEGPARPAFCEALRNSMSLKTLKLISVNLWADVAAATQLIAALEVLPALQEVLLSWNHVDVTPATQHVAGECLARLIARSTSLRILDASGYRLGETGLAPIFEALCSNNSLTELRFFEVLDGDCELISAEFARDMVLPAVRANTSLRELSGLQWVDAPEIDYSDEDEEEEELLPELQELEDILAARRQADEEAA